MDNEVMGTVIILSIKYESTITLLLTNEPDQS